MGEKEWEERSRRWNLEEEGRRKGEKRERMSFLFGMEFGRVRQFFLCTKRHIHKSN
jgi:hypothetical protein